jgi:hypothetical protein
MKGPLFVLTLKGAALHAIDPLHRPSPAISPYVWSKGPIALTTTDLLADRP